MEAESADGRWRVVAEPWPDTARDVGAASAASGGPFHELLIVDRTRGAVVRRFAVADRRGVRTRVVRLVDAAPRRSIVALLADVPEAWELSYDPAAEPVFEGLVHDYRTGEGIPGAGPLPVRRLHLDEPLTDVLFAPDFVHFVGHAGGGVLHVVNLHVRRRIETVATGGAPRPALGTSCMRGRRVLYAIPDAERPVVYELDGAAWSVRVLPAPPGAAAAGPCGTNASAKQ